MNEPSSWKIRYKYESPGPAGPLLGSVVVKSKPTSKRGDTIRAVFGWAVVTSVRAQSPV